MSGTLMFSVSGLRGLVGTDLTPEVVALHAAALATWARDQTRNGRAVIVLGRDARTSGEMFAHAAAAGCMSVGADVLDIGMVPTPTVQLAVEHHGAAGGIILTASHNPVAWNALKFVGPDGAFLDGAGVEALKRLVAAGPPRGGWDGIGSFRCDGGAIAFHLDRTLALPILDLEAIRRRAFRVALDCVRGAGGAIIPQLLERLGCTVSAIHTETDGRFPREPEPIPEHLTELGALVRSTRADIGMAVDPDVDRLALVDQTGTPIGEDYTLAFATRAVLGRSGNGGARPRGPVVTNLSTSLVVEDAARDHGARCVRAPVGEANVVGMIRAEQAVIGGEGNGGVIYPALHLGRDAPLGVALILQYLVDAGQTVSELVASAPRYVIVKAKVARGEGNLGAAYAALRMHHPEADADQRDGLRLAWPDRWVHLRPSGTEPVIRIIAEAPTVAGAEELVASGRRAIGVRS